MDSTKINIFLSLAIIATLFALSTVESVNPYCDTVPDKTFCTDMIMDGQTWRGAMTNALKFTKRVLKANSTAILVDPMNVLATNNKVNKEAKKNVEDKCSGAYGDVIANNDECFALLRDNNYMNLKAKIATINIGGCMDALKGAGVIVPSVVKYNADAQKMVSYLQAILDKRPQV